MAGVLFVAFDVTEDCQIAAEEQVACIFLARNGQAFSQSATTTITLGAEKYVVDRRDDGRGKVKAERETVIDRIRSLR